jgi:hypothetical protein
MPALTKPLENYEKPGLVVGYVAAPNISIFKGAMVGINATGTLVPMSSSTANLKFVGVANESIFANANPGGRTINVTKVGSFIYNMGSGQAVPMPGTVLFALTDNEVVNSAAGLANAVAIGTCIRLESNSNGGNGARVRIDNHTV